MKQSWVEQCLEALATAVEHDANDHLVHFYLALTYALCRQINQALVQVQTALRLRGEHLPSLILLALLLSTSAAPSSEDSSEDEERHGALLLVEATLEEYPHNFDLLYVKALLEEQCLGGETALLTAKEMLALWKHLYEDTASTGGGEASAGCANRNNLDARSVALSGASAHPLSNDMADRESTFFVKIFKKILIKKKKNFNFSIIFFNFISFIFFIYFLFLFIFIFLFFFVIDHCY